MENAPAPSIGMCRTGRVAGELPAFRALVGSPLSEAVMKAVVKSIVGFVKEEKGTETLEWGLVCGLIVVGAIAAITIIGPKVTGMWNATATKVQAAPNP